MSVVQPKCPECRSDRFELRLMKDEGIGAAMCAKCGRYFLLLDSEDYWFDVIQAGYPKQTTCTCKNGIFKLQLDYRFRDDGDVEWIGVTSLCTACGKSQRRLSIDIDYSPTQQLLKMPLTPCENPKLLFDQREVTLYVKPADMNRVVQFLADQGCSFSGQVRARNESILRQLSAGDAGALIARRADHLAFTQILASLKPLKLSQADLSTAKKEDRFWKRHEVIQFDAPFTMVWGSHEVPLYYIHFSNEYIRGQQIVRKSVRFRQLTAALVDWLGQQFVSWRGPNCFDNEQVHRQVFGAKYQGKAKK